MPQPLRPTSDELASGQLDSQWIELRGVVRSVVERGGGLVLNVSSGAFECLVFVLKYPSLPTDIVDGQVRIRGVFAGLYDPSSIRVIGFQVLTPSWSDVQVLERPTQRLWSAPVRPIRLLLRLTPGGAFSHRVRVRGVVTLQQLGQFLCIRDSEGALLVNTTQPTPVKVGDLIDAMGFPAIGDYTVIMRDAIFRRVGGGPAPEPVVVSPEELRAGNHDADLVRLSAQLLNYTTRPGEQVLELQAGGVTFRAVLSTATNRSSLGSLRVASLLQLTGVTMVEADKNHELNGFELLLRSPADVVVLRLPSWWTVRRALLVLGLLAAAVILALGWIAALRRRVRQQTEALRLEFERELALEEQYRDLFENASDLIQWVDPQGRLVHVNPAWRKTLGYSEEEVANLTLFEIVHPNSQEHCRQLFQRLMSGAKIEGVEAEFIARSGETVALEGSCDCKFVDGKPVSSRGIFRNVTERKRAEAQLADRLRFEILLADLSARFVNVPAEKLDDEIEEALRRVGECLGVEASSLWQVSAETPRVVRLTHLYRPLGGPPLPERMDAQEYFPWCYRQIVDLKAKVIAVSSLEELPANAARDREAWRQLGVKSTLVIVLSVGGGTPVGALSFNTMGAERTWSEEIVNRLQLVAQIFSNALARQGSDRALRRSEQFNREVISNAQEGVIVYDREFRFLVWNRFMEELTGMPAEQVLGKCGFDMFPHLREQNVEPLLRRALAGETLQSHDMPFFVRETAKSGWVSATYSPHFGPDGQITGVIAIVRNISGRRQAEQALRAAEEKFRKAFDACPEPMAIRTIPEGRYLEANDAFIRLAGCRREEIIGKTVTELGIYVNREDLDRENALIARDGKVHDYEAPLGWKSRELIHALVSAERIVLGGQPCLLLVAKDITERRRIEQALRDSEQRYRTLFENSPVGIYRTTPDGRILAGNPAFARMLGYSCFEELASRNLNAPDFEPEYSRGEFKEQLEKEGRITGLESQWRRRDGSVIFVRENARAIRDDSGRLLYYEGTCEDVTERKRAEEALRESEDRYRDLVEHSQDIICTHDLEGRILSVNELPARSLGYERSELLKKRIQDILVPEVREKFGKYMALMQRDGAVKGLMLVQTAAGEQRTLEYNNTLRTEGVPAPVVRAVAHDVTERKRAEEERQRSLEQLRALAAHLESVREEERKRAAREIHDQLGQALTAIKLDLSSLARKSPADPEEHAKRTSSILNLVDETIRSVRRISTELRPGMLDDLGLAATVEWAAEEFATRTGMKCRLDLPQEHIAIDPQTATAVFRILQETLTNVARHAKASEVMVRLAKEDSNLTLEVHDNGTGIAADKLSSASSLGILGMRERALLLGGDLIITGAPGRGTTMRVRIPEARGT
jgi:PAS domain S-box-containing protein